MTSIRYVGLLTPAWPGQTKANGIATSVYFLAHGLREIGVTPVILAWRIDGPCPDDIPVIEIRDLGWRWWDRLRARFGDASWEGNRLAARNIAAAVKEASEKYGLDILLMEESSGWAGFLRSLIPQPVFVVLHGPWVLHKSLQSRTSAQEDRKREMRENLGFLAAAGLISPSRNVLEAVEAAAPLHDKPKIVLPNTLAVDPTVPVAVQQKTHDILFIGRFDRHKGGDTVIEAFTHLIETHPHARLTFAGVDGGVRQPDGSLKHLETVLPELPDKVRSRLTYKGRVDRAEVAQLRKEHAIALFASRYEVFGYTLIEAMGAGQAVVSTNVGGPSEILEHEQTALLVPAEDAVGMAAALGRLIDDSGLRVKLGTAARRQVLSEFDPVVVAKQTMSFVKQTLTG